MPSNKENIDILEKKIEAIKKKQKEKSAKEVKISPLANGINIVIELVSGVVVGASIGYILNEVFDFGKVFLLIMIIMGGFAGLLNVSRSQTNSSKEELRK